MNNKNNLKYENDSLFSEHALKRLKDGYMREDETSPQERFRFVADSFGSNKEHSDRIYEYASNLWLSFSTPLLAYGKNKNALPVSCFEENTLVQTSEGMKRIIDIKIGDSVFSHDNQYHKVLNTKSEISEDTYELEFNSEIFFVTGNHLILTQEDGWVRVDELCQSYHTILSL